MKKSLWLILILVMALSFSACVEKTTNNDNSTNTNNDSNTADQTTSYPEETTKEEEKAENEISFSISLDRITTLEDLESRIEEQLANSITSLESRWEALSVEIDTYDKYCDNSEKVSEFYQTVIAETEQMCIMLCEYSAAYARMILDSDMSADDKYDAIDGLNDCLYDDACDEIHDEIYEGTTASRSPCRSARP